MPDMAEKLHQERSELPFDRHAPGCMSSLLHFLDLHHRFRIRKMLPYHRHGIGHRPARMKIPRRKRNPPPADDNCKQEGDANCLEEGKANSPSKSPRNVLARAFVSKKRSREKDQKVKLPPLIPRLPRTLSIHHLQCNDYVLPDEPTSGDEITTSELSEENTGSSSNDRPSLQSHKKCEVCGSINTMDCAGTDQLGRLDMNLVEGQSHDQSKELMDLLQLFHGKRELFHKLLQNPSLLFKKGFQDRQDSFSEGTVLTKSGTFPRPGFSRKRDALFGSSPKINKGKAKSDRSFEFPNQESPSVPRTEEHTEQDKEPMDYGKGNSLGLEVAARGTIRIESGSQRAGTDSNCFKAIKERLNVLKENKKELARITNDSFLHKIPYGQKVIEPPRSKHRREGADLSNSKSMPRNMTRSCSLSESLDRYSCLLESISSRNSNTPPQKSKFAEEGTSVQFKTSPIALKRICSLPDMESYYPRKYVQNEQSDASQLLNSYTSSDNVAKEMSNASDNLLADESSERSTSVTDANEYTDDTPIATSPANCSLSGSEFSKPGQIDIEEVELVAGLNQLSDAEDNNNEAADLVADFSVVQLETEQDHTNFLSIQVDEKDEADFLFVKDILEKSGFIGNEMLGHWYSPDQPVDPVFFEEAECWSHHEFDMIGDEHDVVLNHMLLFDLINEALLEIYDPSFVFCSWLPRFEMHARRIPVGHRVLEEVWANISRQLSSELQLDQSVEDVVAQDFWKNDGWMNLQSDSEYIGLELEDLMLDELVDDVVLQLDELSVSKYT